MDAGRMQTLMAQGFAWSIAEFCEDCGGPDDWPSIETINAALEDAKSDAPQILERLRGELS